MMELLIVIVCIWYLFHLLIYMHFRFDPMSALKAPILIEYVESLTPVKQSILAFVDPSDWFLYRYFKSLEDKS